MVASSPPPVTPRPTPGTRELLELLHQVGDAGLLAGQHNQPAHGSLWSVRAGELAGALPALSGWDIGFSAPGTLDGVDFRERNVAEAIAWHRRHGIVTWTWHSVSPFEDEPVEFEGGILRDLSPAEWDQLLDEGTPAHARWCSQVDVAADILGRLDAAGVPVLWRPYHEMNGGWFWWGGDPDRFPVLWRMLFDRLVHGHGLHNLVWVWSPNAAYGAASPFAPFHPGHDVVDVLTADVYDFHYEREHYEALLDLADGRPIGLGEVGELPTPEVLDDQPRWTWFMAWADLLEQRNDPATVHRLYTDPRVITLDTLADLRSGLAGLPG